MVRAELVYNPYLLETDVRFNGEPPRINSLIEKYRGEKLQSWIGEIPSYFHDEMNGYDFELLFSGTELDFDELKESFLRAGIDEKRVRLSLQEKLGDRNEKVNEIEELLHWLETNPNRRFDWRSFRSDHEELFDNAYPFVVIGETKTNDKPFNDIDIAVDKVESVEELRKTDLHSTPILVCLDRRSVGSLQHNLRGLLSRLDVIEDQLFFLISPELREKTERVIKDLGVNKPLIVSSTNDNQIHRYLEVFPVAERVHDAINVFRKQVEEIGELLIQENKKSELANKEIHEEINNLDDVLDRLKSTRNLFLDRGVPDYPADLLTAKTGLFSEIRRWRSKKTKIVGEEEAEKLSIEYEMLVARKLAQFRQELIVIHAEECNDYLLRCSSLYRGAKYDEGYAINETAVSFLPECALPPISSELLNLKVVQEASPKEDFFAGLGMLFNSSNDNSQEPEMETVFYCETWRTHVEGIVLPIANKMLKEAYNSLCDYLDRLCKGYVARLEEGISGVSEKRAQVLARLSEDERLLQTDNDWHSAFRDKLSKIERS